MSALNSAFTRCNPAEKSVCAVIYQTKNNAAVCGEEVETHTNFFNSTTDLLFGNGPVVAKLKKVKYILFYNISDCFQHVFAPAASGGSLISEKFSTFALCTLAGGTQPDKTPTKCYTEKIYIFGQPFGQQHYANTVINIQVGFD